MTDPEVVKMVVRYLGRGWWALLVGSIALVAYVLQQSSGSRTVDPAAIAAMGSIVSLTTGVGGTLGGVLISTRSGPAETRIVNKPDDAVPVEPGA